MLVAPLNRQEKRRSEGGISLVEQIRSKIGLKTENTIRTRQLSVAAPGKYSVAASSTANNSIYAASYIHRCRFASRVACVEISNGFCKGGSQGTKPARESREPIKFILYLFRFITFLCGHFTVSWWVSFSFGASSVLLWSNRSNPSPYIPYSVKENPCVKA